MYHQFAIYVFKRVSYYLFWINPHWKWLSLLILKMFLNSKKAILTSLGPCNIQTSCLSFAASSGYDHVSYHCKILNRYGSIHFVPCIITTILIMLYMCFYVAWSSNCIWPSVCILMHMSREFCKLDCHLRIYSKQFLISCFTLMESTSKSCCGYFV